MTRIVDVWMQQLGRTFLAAAETISRATKYPSVYIDTSPTRPPAIQLSWSAT